VTIKLSAVFDPFEAVEPRHRRRVRNLPIPSTSCS